MRPWAARQSALESDNLSCFWDFVGEGKVVRGFYCAVAMACILATSPAAADDYRHLVIGGHELKWGAPILGVGAVVTYALAEFPERFPNARNCPEIVPLPSVLKRNGIELPFFSANCKRHFPPGARSRT